MKQSLGQIYLAQERGVHEAEWFRSHTLFNFGSYQQESRHPFAGIYLFNDDALDADCSIRMEVPESSCILLLPVIGAISCTDPSGQENLVAAGQTHLFMAGKDQHFTIANPFSEGLVNYLQIWIRLPFVATGSYMATYDITRYPNQFRLITPPAFGTEVLPFKVSIGAFGGRKETVYTTNSDDSRLFLFAIEGAFETEGRLLHARDGLALWDTRSAETEALSQGALMLLIESCIS